MELADERLFTYRDMWRAYIFGMLVGLTGGACFGFVLA